MVKSDTVYEYKKIKPIEDFYTVGVHNIDTENCLRILKNKINELLIEQNQMAKDFELYKKAHKRLKIEFDTLQQQIEGCKG